VLSGSGADCFRRAGSPGPYFACSVEPGRAGVDGRARLSGGGRCVPRDRGQDLPRGRGQRGIESGTRPGTVERSAPRIRDAGTPVPSRGNDELTPKTGAAGVGTALGDPDL